MGESVLGVEADARVKGGERFFVVPPLGEPYTASQKGKSDL
jgi:hypothetical protein